MKNGIKAAIKYFAIFCIYILLCESVFRFVIMKEGTGFPTFVIFIPAQALFLVLFCGIVPRKTVNRIIAISLLLIICAFYIVELLYYRQFGSPMSISLISMGGQAVTEFWWAFKGTLVKSIGYIRVFLLPIPLLGILIFSRIKPADYIPFLLRGVLLPVVIVIWLCAVFGLNIGGQEKHSAYYIYHNAYSDTETSVKKLGVLTTTIVEAKAYFLGINSNGKSESFEIKEVEELPVAKEQVSSNSYFAEKKDEIIEDNSDKKIDEKTEDKPEENIRFHIDESIDFDYLKSNTTDDDVKALCNYFSHKAPEAENEYTGLFEGYNLIYICAESFTSYGMDEKLTPILWEMSHNGIVLNNYYSSFKNTTTNGEFAYSVSLWPDVSRKAADGNAVGSFACSSDKFMPYGLGNVFNKLGIPTYAFHGYVGSYYSRETSWPNLGYKNIKFMYDGLSFDNKWSPTDTELMEQTVDDYIGNERFFTYYMTFSGHGDYTTDTYIYFQNNKEVRSLVEGKGYTDSEISYLCGNYELEKALEYLIERLKETGQLDRTVIVLAGDHIPYNLMDEEMADMSKKSGLSFDYNFDKYKSTCIIYNALIESPIICDEYCCTVDIIPTVLNLMGIDFDSRLIAGIDVFDSSYHRARLYNGNLLTEYVNYNASNGKCMWKGPAEDWDDEKKNNYIEAITTQSDNEYMVSLKLMEKDFYRYIFKNLKKTSN